MQMTYVSHRSHESHEEHLLSLVLTSGMCTLGEADKRGRSDAPSVRFLGRAKRKHCEICVR